MLGWALTVALCLTGGSESMGDNDPAHATASDSPGVSEAATPDPAPETGAAGPAVGGRDSPSPTPPGVGWLGVLSAAVAGALYLLRLGALDAALARWRLKPHKPLLAAGLGCAAAVLALLVTGEYDPATVAQYGVAGLIAGLGATGAHQAITRGR